MSTVPSYEFCAFHYLDWWLEGERELQAAFSAGPTERHLRDALQYFGVSRTFKGLHEAGSAEFILQSLKLACNPESTQTAEEKVLGLAKTFKSYFKTHNLSAASKLLWLSCRTPFVIYDSRAERSLMACGHSSNSYAEYCEAWRSEYKRAEDGIRAACRELPKARTFLRSTSMTDQELLAFAGETWFIERVFDVFLWETGAKEFSKEESGETPSTQPQDA